MPIAGVVNGSNAAAGQVGEVISKQHPGDDNADDDGGGKEHHDDFVDGWRLGCFRRGLVFHRDRRGDAGSGGDQHDFSNAPDIAKSQYGVLDHVGGADGCARSEPSVADVSGEFDGDDDLLSGRAGELPIERPDSDGQHHREAGAMNPLGMNI